MGTSLAEQLKKLRAPQTGILLQDKKRPSLLFDPKEAAKLDRETVLSIGQSGLQELIKLSSVFNEFQNSLFSSNSINLERSVHDAKVNEKLNAGIEKFLVLLSPYFLINNAHKSLEWLIHRFHIHEFNRDQFLLLILPYHETRIFVRALQLLNLSDSTDKWHWLQSLQKPGIPLASITFINRISSDNGLLKLLCGHVIAATEIYASQAVCLSTLYAFFTIAMLGLINHTSAITEIQINHLLPTLIKGLRSSIPDYSAGSYMILAKLTTKIKLKDDTMEKLLKRAFKNPCLNEEVVLLLVFLYDSPYHQLMEIPSNLIHQLSKLSWFPEMLTRIHSSKGNVSRFVVLFLQSGCREILENPTKSSCIEDMINKIISSIKLENDMVDAILSNILNHDFFANKVSQESKNFLTQFYQALERGYPERFDNYLKNLMNCTNRDNKRILQFLTSWHFGARDTNVSVDILDGLVHISPEQRIMALEALANENVSVPETFYETMMRALKSIFSDSEANVIRTLLTFPVKRLTKLFPTNALIDELLTLLSTCHTESRKMLAKSALRILLELFEEGDDTSVFIITLPYLFPKKDVDVDVAMEILLSKFAMKNRYMQQVKKDIGRSASAETVTFAAFHNILNWELLPPTENILNVMKQQISYGDATSIFFNMVLLGSVCRVPVGSIQPQLAREVIEIATKMIQKYPRVQMLADCNNLTGNNIQAALELTSQGILPLQVGTYVLEMVHRRLDLKSNFIFDFENNSECSNLTLRLLEMFFEGIDDKLRRKHYSRCLQIFFQRHFATMKDLIHFLSQLFIKPVKVQTSYNCLQISLVLLDQYKTIQWAFQDKIFMTNLLLSLARRNNECRSVAINILKKLTQIFDLTVEPFSAFLQELSKRSSEIALDPDQVSLTLYVLLSPDPDVNGQLKSDLRKKLQIVQKQLFDIVTNVVTPVHVKSQLLDILVHVNGPEILQQVTPLGLDILQNLSADANSKFTGNVIKNILQRFNSTTVAALINENVWQLFETSILEQKIQLLVEGKLYSSNIILLKQIDETFFAGAGFSLQLQAKILSKLIDVATDSDIGNVISQVNKVVRRIRMNAVLVVNELQKMKKFEAEAPDDGRIRAKKRVRQTRLIPSPALIDSREWKRGTILLEYAQQAKNIEKEEMLYPILFDLLKLCITFEEQSPVEYINQLLLSTIHRLTINKLPIRDAHLQVDIIAQCIRTSRNPQTHHHALLVLVELLKMIDIRSALYSIMPIFTFMGSTVVRQDDAYSIQIISKTIDTVVPIINAKDNEIYACEILRTFIVSLPDIPEHRRTPLFVKLLQLLDNHLHLYYLLTFESHILSKSARITNQKTPEQRLEFALNISREFSPARLMHVCIKLVEFMKELPTDVEEEKDRKAAISFPYKHIFNVAKNTPKQLRHYKFTLIQFISRLLSAPELINRIAELNVKEINEITPYYDHLIVKLIVLIYNTSKNVDIHQGKAVGKYWKVLLHHLYDVLDLVNNLLPNNIFLISIKSLLEHELLTVKRKALELLNVRLQQRQFGEDSHIDLLNLIEPLIKMIDPQMKNEIQEVEIVQQTVLITLKLLAKLLAIKHATVFKPILEMTTVLLKSRSGPILGSAVLCIAELCNSMRTYAIQSLNKFMPAIMQLLKNHCHEDIPDVITISLVSALQKIVESVGNFLSLYLDQLLHELATLSSFYTDMEHPKIGMVVSRLKATTQKLSSSIPLRVMLPAINRTYVLLKEDSYRCISSLLNILAECFACASLADLNPSLADLATFFLKVLQFREDIAIDENHIGTDKKAKLLKDITNVEESAGNTFVALVLKLNEATFRPLYYKLYDWAARNPHRKERNITFYRLSANIAECLKSLFVLFAGHFVKHAALLLNDNCLTSKEKGEFTLSEEKSRIELIEAVLLTLHRVFTYDAHNFVNQERFETLAQPIVDQLENTIGSNDEYVNRANKLIIPCIASFAGAIPDDSLHKQLVYQTLLKTKHTKPYVRSAALNALVEIARKLGEDFMPLLPETVPSLAELLEDEDETTEKCAQNAVRTLEDILEEPLQKYF